MSLSDDLKFEIDVIFKKNWTIVDGYVVPKDDAISLDNDGKRIDATVLYADLSDSTGLVDYKTDTFAAEVYKSFLITSCRIIGKLEGSITAFDGDRIMAVYIGEFKNTNAVKSALQINWAVQNIINPALQKNYTSSNYVVTHGVGVDTGKLLVAKTGIRGSNDLVWVGPAANYAAKLCSLRSDGYSTLVSKDVFDVMNKSTKYDAQGNLVWEARTWQKYSKSIYASNATLSF